MFPSGKNHSSTFPPSFPLQQLVLTLVVMHTREDPGSDVYSPTKICDYLGYLVEGCLLLSTSCDCSHSTAFPNGFSESILHTSIDGNVNGDTTEDLFQAAKFIAEKLSEKITSNSPIGLYGRNCPQLLTAILAAMSVLVDLDSEGGVISRGVAYLPVDLSNVAWHQERSLMRCDVEVVLIEISAIEEFISSYGVWAACHLVSIDTSLLQLGFLLARISWTVDKRSECSIDRVELQDPATLQEYEQNCDLSCYMCQKELEGDSNVLSHKTCQQDTDASSHNLAAQLLSCNGRPVVSTYPGSIAYVLYTSGTTGDPKMVRVPHCSIVPNIVDLRSRFTITPDDIIYNAAPLTFDPSIVEIFLSLSTGSQLLMVPDVVKRSPSKLASVLLHQQHTSVLQITPSLMFRFHEDVIREMLGPDSHIRILAFGGEACPTMETLMKWKSPKNTTEMFNIYGITEVSSWATCHKISIPPSQGDQTVIPLGDPLLGTQVEVRDVETGDILTSGYGQIWIGGNYRVCLVDDETMPPADGMWCSGDHGYIDGDSHLVYHGRSDHQVKRWGHRINLDIIQQSIISKLDEVSSCVLYSHLSEGGAKLVGFIVPNRSFSPLAAGKKADHELTERNLLSKMRGLLPSHCIPDRVILVNHFPLTAHGKVDIESLLASSQLEDHTLDVPPTTHLEGSVHLHPDMLSLDFITSLLMSSVTSLSLLDVCSLDTSLLSSGVNSFDIVRIANQVEAEIENAMNLPNIKIPQLLEKLFECNIGEVGQFIADRLSEMLQNLKSATSRKRLAAHDTSPSHDSKKLMRVSNVIAGGSHENHMISPEYHVTTTSIVESWRRGQYFINGKLQNIAMSRMYMNSGDETDSTTSQRECQLTTLWKVDTLKCVDASPLLVRRSHMRRTSVDRTRSNDMEESSCIVYIGSHSHLFFALDFKTGEVLWRTELGDRIESSACCSACGEFVIVGCYDGHLYVLSASTGEVHWKFCPSHSKDPIKSSPSIDPLTGYVWFGSHDHHIYAIDIKKKCMVHRLYPGGGSIFSTPCVDSEHRRIYCATLQGLVIAFHLDSGELLWQYSAPKPVFSSLVFIPACECVVFGCVDGHVYSLHAEDGQEISRANTDGCVFSSCCVIHTAILNDMDLNMGIKIFCGSHDKYLYCWNGNLELEWRTKLDSELYSIPFFNCIESKEHGDDLFCLCVCSTAGVLYVVDARKGSILTMLRLPGDLFSSPVSVDNCIILGCRDNNIYCVKLT